MQLSKTTGATAMSLISRYDSRCDRSAKDPVSRLKLRRTRAEDGQEFELSEVVDKLALREERGQQEGWKPERTGEIYSTI